jgi:3',5'-cyclic AMP phosphodiesterase CpdA
MHYRLHRFSSGGFSFVSRRLWLGWSLAYWSLVPLCLSLSPQGSAHEPTGGTQPAPASQSDAARLAAGVVYHDINGNRQRDAEEPGLEGMRVSNGQEIVRTDAEGRYQIPVSDDTIIFLIKPRGWATPLNAQNLPQFYYIHKPAGSPPQKFPGVAPTGPLPSSIDFPLTPQEEPDQFRALMFGDTQARNVQEVEYMTHDIIEQVVAENAHDASLGVTLGDIVFDDLDVFEPHNQSIALIGIPWYNVIGNHDMNFDAADDEHSDETFESYYGPSYYSFDHGPVHFLVLDDVVWHGATEQRRGHYTGGLGSRQMEFIQNDMSLIPEDQLVVLMMHIPLINVEDRAELYRLIEQRPFAISISAHTHFVKHHFIGEEDGWRGKQPHHHIVNVTVCGSWWRGEPDELGIPHAMMSDGGANGYSILSFDGHDYDLEYRAARRPADYQMNIYLPEAITTDEAISTAVIVNVFNGSDKSQVRMRVLPDGEWTVMEQVEGIAPYFAELKALEAGQAPLRGLPLPAESVTDHLWRAMLPPLLPPGTHMIEVETTDMRGKQYVDRQGIRVTTSPRR